MSDVILVLFPPEVVAARDYQESIVFDILAHRSVDDDSTHQVVSNLEFQVQFSRVTQWLPYAKVKHLRLLDDYASQAGFPSPCFLHMSTCRIY
jgi:hypothetical protein